MILPGILVEVIVYKFGWIFSGPSGSVGIQAMGLYGITIIGLLLFYKIRPCSMWVLPFSFLPPVFVCYVNDTLNDSQWLTYLYTAWITVSYSIPGILITSAIALVCMIRENRRKERKTGKEQKGSKKEAFLSAAVLAMAFLVIGGIGMVSISRIHMVRREIIKKIDWLSEQKMECVFKLSEVTKFKWDTVAYFKYPISEEEISRKLGADYTGGVDVSEGFVFAYRGRVVHKDIVGIAPGANRPYLGVEGVDNLAVWSVEDAAFKGRKVDDSFYLIKPVIY